MLVNVGDSDDEKNNYFSTVNYNSRNNLQKFIVTEPSKRMIKNRNQEDSPSISKFQEEDTK